MHVNYTIHPRHICLCMYNYSVELARGSTLLPHFISACKQVIPSCIISCRLADHASGFREPGYYNETTGHATHRNQTNWTILGIYTYQKLSKSVCARSLYTMSTLFRRGKYRDLIIGWQGWENGPRGPWAQEAASSDICTKARGPDAKNLPRHGSNGVT